jgi:thymidylate synthase
MATLVFESGYTGYRELVEYVIKNGERREPRGLPTLDAGATTIELLSPYDALPLDQGRALNRAIGAAEAIQLIGAFSRPAMMVKISSSFKAFINTETGSFHGAYGNRVGMQVGCAVNKLRADAATRQAVVTLWDPWLDNLPGEVDYPCTVGFQFQVNSHTGELEMHVIMRSSDVWLGIPYDLFQFTQLQLTVAAALNRPAGKFSLTTLSLHIYERDLESAERLHPSSLTDPRESQPTGFGRDGDTWSVRKSRAHALGNLGQTQTPEGLTKSEEWYRDVLSPYVS